VTSQPSQAAVACGSDSYINSAGNCIPRPSPTTAAGRTPTAVCRDGAYSYSASRSGTCSGHGGVAQWLG
jgi:hypothetical protein